MIFESQGELNEEKLNRVYILDAQGKGIKELTGLEKCKNLASLRLTNNQIADVKPLKELNNLQSLDLAKNQIKDVAPLAGLTNLQYLELSNNQISDIAPLKGLKRLTTEGAWFQNAAYPYMSTLTCVGHTTIATGTLPYHHGIIQNAWFDRASGRSVNACIALLPSRAARFSP